MGCASSSTADSGTQFVSLPTNTTKNSNGTTNKDATKEPTESNNNAKTNDIPEETKPKEVEVNQTEKNENSEPGNTDHATEPQEDSTTTKTTEDQSKPENSEDPKFDF